jgi:hypothetical protein
MTLSLACRMVAEGRGFGDLIRVKPEKPELL